MFKNALKQLTTAKQRLEFINKIVAQANQLPEPYQTQMLNRLAQDCQELRQEAV
jgi:hypothetical protein